MPSEELEEATRRLSNQARRGRDSGSIACPPTLTWAPPPKRQPAKSQPNNPLPPTPSFAKPASFNRDEREARDSNAVPCPSRSPFPAQTGEGVAEIVVFLRERKRGAGHQHEHDSRGLVFRDGC